MQEQRFPTSSPGGSSFAATRWSVVLAAAGSSGGRGEAAAAGSRAALGELIQAYWFPLYSYLRRRGRSVEEAEDLTQGFFARLLEKKSLAEVDRAKGKFRSFWLAALQHFAANEWDKQTALKRGGLGRPIALDALDAEARYALEPMDGLTPERVYERRWALAVLERVLQTLEAEYAGRGHGALFATLKGTLAFDGGTSSHAAAAATLGTTAGAVKVAAHRLRKRYRELLRAEIGRTVDRQEEVEEEIKYLLRCL